MIKRLLLILVVLVVAARLALPWAIKTYANRELRNNPEYGGHIGGVSLGLLAGRAKVSGVEITQKRADKETPLFSADAVTVSVNPSLAIRKKIFLVNGRLDHP